MAGPSRVDSRLGLRKVGAARRERKMKRKIPSQKEPKKVTRIDANSVKNLDTELALPSADTLLKSQSMFIQNLSHFLLMIFLPQLTCLFSGGSVEKKAHLLLLTNAGQ